MVVEWRVLGVPEIASLLGEVFGKVDELALADGAGDLAYCVEVALNIGRGCGVAVFGGGLGCIPA